MSFNMKFNREEFRSMPQAAKRLFNSAYSKALFKGFSEDEATRIAFSALSEMFVVQKGVWTVRSKANTSAVISKSGLFFPKYFVEAVLTSNSLDSHGHIVDERFIENITSILEEDGDIEHSFSQKNDGSFKGSLKLVNKYVKDGKVYVKFSPNKEHGKYKEALNWIKTKYDEKKPIELSADYYNPVVRGNRIVGASRVGWSVVDYASNRDAKQVM